MREATAKGHVLYDAFPRNAQNRQIHGDRKQMGGGQRLGEGGKGSDC